MITMTGRDCAELADLAPDAEQDEPPVLRYIGRRIAPLFEDEADLQAELDEMVRLGLLTVVDGDRYQPTGKADAMLDAAPQGEREWELTLFRDPLSGRWVTLANEVATDER